MATVSIPIRSPGEPQLPAGLVCEIYGGRSALFVNAKEFKRWPAAKGWTFETKRSGSGHLVVRLGDKITDLPRHGGRKELGTGLVNAIKTHLGLR